MLYEARHYPHFNGEEESEMQQGQVVCLKSWNLAVAEAGENKFWFKLHFLERWADQAFPKAVQSGDGWKER